jgi:phage gp29-like protein
MAPKQTGLVDMHGRAISARSLKVEQAGAELRAVRRNDTFHPASGLTPQKLARILRDSIDGDPEPYLALAEDMEERNEHYAGVLGTRKRQVSGLERQRWRC